MKFTVSQSALSEALATVMKGIAGTSTLPILSGVLIKAVDGVLEFQTSNYTIAIRHRRARGRGGGNGGSVQDAL